jgi:hypothetical protein
MMFDNFSKQLYIVYKNKLMCMSLTMYDQFDSF